MFVTIGKIKINLNQACSIDEGIGGALRLRMTDGNVYTARQPEEIAAVNQALDAMKPVKAEQVLDTEPVAKAAAKKSKKASDAQPEADGG